MNQDQTKSAQQNNETNTPRDGALLSLWQQISFPKNHSRPDPGKVYDAIIIGGGITGLTTALLLQLENKDCIILENKTLGYGTTGGTTAHLNTFFDATYPEIEKDFSEDAARLVADSGKKAINTIKTLIDKYSINCDFEYKNALLFSEEEKQTRELEEILESSKRAGIAVAKASTNNLPVPFDQVIQFNDQAQFHPLKYLAALTDEFLKAGGTVAENQFVKIPVLKIICIMRKQMNLEFQVNTSFMQPISLRV
jgi:glycine/D-amino acid oxidase-like deaminating enzyme